MHIPHELPEEFPGEAALIERLARDNYLFKRLAIRYDDVNRQIYRIESEEQPTEDAVLERLKKIASSSRMRSPACSRAKSAECKAGWSTSDPQRRNAVRVKVIMNKAAFSAF